QQLLRLTKKQRQIVRLVAKLACKEPALLVDVRPARPVRPETDAERLSGLERRQLEEHDVAELEVELVHALRVLAAGVGLRAAIASIHAGGGEGGANAGDGALPLSVQSAELSVQSAELSVQSAELSVQSAE